MKQVNTLKTCFLKTHFNIITPSTSITGRDSSVGIATRYGLDGQGIESRWGARFSATVQPTQSPVQWVPGLFRE